MQPVVIVPSCLVLALLLGSPACTAVEAECLDAAPPQASASVAPGNPMSSFARMVGGEWRTTLASGQSFHHSWHWGPGRFSMRRMAWPSDAPANPWTGEVMYWHPGRGEVRVLSLHEDIPAVGRGVGEGSIRFEGEATESVVELEQPRGIRRLVQLQIFDGPDKYREPLLEDTGSGRQPLNELSFVRVEARPVAPAPGVERAMIELPESWKPFEPLVRGNWESDGAQAGGALRVRTTFDWEPSLEMILARTSAVNAEGAATPLFEAFIYRQVRSPALRCLVLSHRGAVHEGDVSVLDGGALQAELKLFEDARGVPQLARFEIEGDGRLRTRVWSLEGAERTLALDVAMKHAEP